MIVLFIVSLVVMGMMPQNFFPSLDKPYFRADVFYPDGYGVNDVAREMKKVEAHLQKLPEVKKYRSPSEALRCVTTWRLPP